MITIEDVAAKQREMGEKRQSSEDRRTRLESSLSIPPRSAESDTRVRTREAEAATREADSKRRHLLANAGIPRRHAAVTKFAGNPWLDACDRLAHKLGDGFIAALIGPRGTGKTQLAAELIRRTCAALRPARYAKAMDIFLAIREAFSSDRVTESEQAKKFIAPGLLVIDEYSVRGESAWEDRVLTHIIDRRYDDQHDTILISNQSAADFEASAGPSIISRLNETGGVIECSWPSFRLAGVG